MLSLEDLVAFQRVTREVYVDPRISAYVVELVNATRVPSRQLAYGASPRASIHLAEGARAIAFLRGRDYALPEDVADVAADVLRHRLVLSYEALAEGITAEDLIDTYLEKVRLPSKPMQRHARVAVAAGS